MKKVFFACLLFIVTMVPALAQQNAQGINYQAVARNLKGEILANQPIALKLSLFSNSNGKTEYYTEVHEVTTSVAGIFSLIVGAGTSPGGTFSTVPWSTENIWLEVAIKSKGQGSFTTISNSKLLAVPYAYHALTAGKVAGTDANGNNAAGSPAQSWLLFGNSSSDASKDKLGTTDSVDLVMVTNNTERLRIFANGNVGIKKSLNVGEDLTVEKNVYLNKTSGATINYGPFTVDRQSASLLSGTLTVDQSTDLNATLNVDGPADLNSRLNVNNASPTLLTGKLTVNQDALFKEHVLLDDSTLQAFSPGTGALVVAGGLGIGRDLYVGGNAFFDGPLRVTDSTQSVSDTTGALIIAGGAGVGKNLNVGGNFRATGTSTLNNTLNVTAGSDFIANFVNTNTNVNSNGISIQVGSAVSTNANNFVEFRNGGGTVVGRIEGETVAQLNADDDFINDKRSFDWEVIAGTIDVTIAGFELAQAGIQLGASFGSSTACVGFGACVTVPILSLIISAGADVILKAANVASTSLSLVNARTTRDNWVNKKENNIGVTYQSGSADYAEWLPKANTTESFLPGYIVGIKNGFISKNLEGASQLFVISTKPILLGNMPENGKEAGYEKVAFMGQVPVHVMGNVNAGDYILPSGSNNGFGKGVSPKNMKAEDYANIVGVAWSSSANGIYDKVNVAIGLNTGDVSKVVAEQSKEITALKSQMNETNAILAKLIPGFKEAAGIKETATASNASPVAASAAVGHDYHFPEATADNIVYFKLEREQVLAMFTMAEKIFNENGGDTELNPFWKKIKTDGAYKETVIRDIEAKFENAVHSHKEMNKQYLRAK
jgi:hypothetical protein